jgi:hypothetical protein
MIRWRRLIRDYKKRIYASNAMILVAMGGNMSKIPTSALTKLTPPPR